MECHLNWNVTQNGMLLKWNVTKNGMSLEIGISLKTQCQG